jgi:hypothetical protein
VSLRSDAAVWGAVKFGQPRMTQALVGCAGAVDMLVDTAGSD